MRYALKTKKSEAGNVIFYIFAAFALLAFLIFSLTKGVDESAVSAQTQEMASLIKSDIVTIHNTVQECVLMYQKPVDIDGGGVIDASDNPNPPYPIYDRTGTGFGGTGVDLKTIICPGKPVANDDIFNGTSGQFLARLSRTKYTVTYFTDTLTGIKITIHNSEASSSWTEVMARIDMQLDPSNIGIVDIDTATGTCATGGGCLIYWIKKN